MQDYETFVEKFKTKKTTDDCYTPSLVYNAVADYVAETYGLNKNDFVRPFYPNGDFEHFDYKENSVVVDNPPFSLYAKILRFYVANGIKFFIFAPSKTLFSGRNLEGVTFLPCDVDVTYDNGAEVNTSFATNLESEYFLRTCPKLHELVKAANKEWTKTIRKQVPRYFYPNNVVTALLAGRYCRYGIDFRVKRSDCVQITKLDAQKVLGKAIFGGGLLLSDKAAAERTAAERVSAKRAAEERSAEHPNATVWELSERERAIISSLGGD